MAAVQAIHECLFCPQTFGTAAAKDDHVLEHFGQETCLECNRNLIRIGSRLYVQHDRPICAIKVLKPERTSETYPSISVSVAQDDSHCVPDESMAVSTVSIKIEQQHRTEEDSNGSIDFDVLDELDDQTAASECDDAQSITSDVESELQNMLRNDEIKIDAKPTATCSTGVPTNVETSVGAIESQFKCDICERTFGRKQSLTKHSIRKHSSPDAIFCRVCVRLFPTIEDRDCHESECAIKKSGKTCEFFADLQCDICDMKCNTEPDYRLHMTKMHGRKIRSIKCKYCSDTFLKKSWLDDHRCPRKLANTSGKSQVPRKQRGSGEIQCNICFAKLSSEHNLRSHMRRKHSTLEKFKCTLCKAIFMRKSSLDAHNCPVQSFTCNICGKQLQRLISLQSHQVRFHSADGIIFCDICTKLFDTADERDAHRSDCILRKRFCGIKNYGKFQCYICKKYIATKGNVLAHMRRKHAADEDKFECSICSHIFMHESSLQQHQCRGKSKYTPTADDVERIPCETCGKVLSRLSLYAHRIAYHSEPGTMFCRLCYKIFPTVDELKLHQAKCRTKRNKKRSCEICGLVLANARTLSRHKISLHSEPGTIFCKTCVKKFKTADELSAHKPECTLKRKLNKFKSNV